MNDDYLAEWIKVFALIVFTTVAIFALIAFIYNVSGAKERDDKRKFECKAQGGEMIYIKGTGDVCIKGVIKID